MLGIDYNFETLRIHPTPEKRILYAKGYLDSPRGRISSEWRYEKETEAFVYHIEIPDEQAAEVQLPGKEKAVLAGGKYDF